MNINGIGAAGYPVAGYETRNTERRELAMKVFFEEMSVYEYARITGGNRRTLDFRKKQGHGKTAVNKGIIYPHIRGFRLFFR